MNIIINTASMIPIYEQIMETIKQKISAGELKEGDALPSVRALAKDLKISALTVKKAYDALEEEGFTATVHGKGSYVRAANLAALKEERLREIEEELSRVIEKARLYELSAEELRELFQILMES
ncbi:MAG: GntR family transcriptional regulator [Lachnospiraceae bacterium]|nr:GntR family transcriptional regulator [Lachnospiraceae bacterium]